MLLSLAEDLTQVWVQKQPVGIELASHGLPLGIEAELGCGETSLELNAGDLVFAYTDGLMEARRDGELYGTDRLTEFVRRMATVQSPDQLVRAVHREVGGWAGGLTDDAVALALRRHA